MDNKQIAKEQLFELLVNEIVDNDFRDNKGRVRAVFTSLILFTDIEVDTDRMDTMICSLYGLSEKHCSEDEFYNYMVEYLV